MAAWEEGIVYFEMAGVYDGFFEILPVFYFWQIELSSSFGQACKQPLDFEFAPKKGQHIWKTPNWGQIGVEKEVYF